MSELDFEFDGPQTAIRKSGGSFPCAACERPMHEHDKEKVFPEKGPAGSYHYLYYCP